jgi:hypothetical protein
MRLPRIRFTLRSMMVAVMLLGLVSWASARYQCWSYFDTGWWEAEREIWRGDVTIYRELKLVCFPDHILEIDRDTGLLVTWIRGTAGQVQEAERITGHNDHVAEYIRSNALPKNSLKPWEEELFNLARFFDDRSQHDAPTRLLAGGAAVVSPDGRNSVRLVRGVLEVEGGLPFVCLEIAADRGVLKSASFPRLVDTDDDIDLLWGPDGSRFVVIRSRAVGTENYVACDLRTGRSFRDEWRVPPEAR